MRHDAGHPRSRSSTSGLRPKTSSRRADSFVILEAKLIVIGEHASFRAIVDAGGDQLLSRSVPQEVLLAAVDAWIRRVTRRAASRVVGPFTIDYATRSASLEGRKLMLRPAAFRLLCRLLEAPNRVVLLQTLLMETSRGYGLVGNLRPHVHEIRRELGPQYRKCLRAVRGCGYLVEVG
jgi:DNA-binding response OmpR family regulator